MNYLEVNVVCIMVEGCRQGGRICNLVELDEKRCLLQNYAVPTGCAISEKEFVYQQGIGPKVQLQRWLKFISR